MAKATRDLAQLIRPAESFPMPVEHIGLTPEDEAALSRTFNRLAQMYHSDNLSRTQVGDCFLLLTTCRNEWYTLNAMLFEAFEWCREGDRYVGFGDALNDLMQAVSGAEPLEKATMRAARRLSAAAYSLEQFEVKRTLFFERFEEVHRELLNFSGEIADDFAREEFHKLYVELGSGPRPEDRLSPDVDERYGLILERLVAWFDVVRPLTGLARTYITEVLGFGKPHRKTSADYLQELEPAVDKWRTTYGLDCPPSPSMDVFARVRPGNLAARKKEITGRLQDFLHYCGALCQASRGFLREMLPVKSEEDGQFLMRQPGEETRVVIGGKGFIPVPNMTVMICDMRNSVPDERSPALKVKIDRLVEALCQEGDAASEFTYDDCRAVGGRTLEKGVRCIVRLWTALEVDRSESGFGGLRLGATRGPMLVGWRGRWEKEEILLDCTNTLARAARLMALDTVRWQETEEGQLLHTRLDDWCNDESLVFIDDPLFRALPETIRSRCRDIGVLPLKGIGNTHCWAVTVQALSGISA